MHNIILVVPNSPLYIGLRVLMVLVLVQVGSQDLQNPNPDFPSEARTGKWKPRVPFANRLVL